MTLRPRAAAVALTGTAVLGMLSLTACSSDDNGGSQNAADTGSAAPSSGAPAGDARPRTPLQEVVLKPGEAPGNGVIAVIDPDQLRAGVDKLVADQGRQLMDQPACDKVSRLETVMNHATTDGVIAAVRYKQAENNETEHQFGVGLVGTRLSEFLDRGLYQACSQATGTGPQPIQLTMTVSDAPPVDGATGFRVTSDFVATDPASGQQVASRVISLHGYAHGTTVSVDYAARKTDPAADPILPEAAAAFDGIYKAQVEKLVKAP